MSIEIFINLVKDKNVSLVGPAQYLTGREMGKEIDKRQKRKDHFAMVYSSLRNKTKRENMRNIFKKKTKENNRKHLINAILDAEKKWPNNMDYGKIMRQFVMTVKENHIIEEDELYDMLKNVSKTSTPCKF